MFSPVTIRQQSGAVSQRKQTRDAFARRSIWAAIAVPSRMPQAGKRTQTETPSCAQSGAQTAEVFYTSAS
jgi:hypothetical protein